MFSYKTGNFKNDDIDPLIKTALLIFKSLLGKKIKFEIKEL